jgi:hypothetical protein
MEQEQRLHRLVAAMERHRPKVVRVVADAALVADVALVAVMEQLLQTSNTCDEFNKEHSDE